ncbi:MAG: hypothetical protein ABSH51_31780 [Solirubrobacteraceae bacterium]
MLASVAAFSNDAGVAAGNELVEDEPRFMNLPRSPLWFGVGHVVIA